MNKPLFASNKNHKTLDSYYLIQYFDFVRNGQKAFAVPKSLQESYMSLFSLLLTLSKCKETLSNQSAFLFMKEAYGTCTIVLHCVDTPNKQTNILFRLEFPKEEWTNIEDLLLNAGLAVCKRDEKRIVRFEFQSPQAQCELLSGDSRSSFTINARDEQSLFECLSKFGKSIDEECITI